MTKLRSRLFAAATAVAAISSTLLAAATPAGAAGSCRYQGQALAVPAGITTASVAATDGRTTFAGQGSAPGRHLQWIVWHDGVPQVLASPYRGGDNRLAAINTAGDIVGSVSVDVGVVIPLWYHDGTFQSSGFGPGSPDLTGINTAGDIVGIVSRDSERVVAIWRAGHVSEPPVVLPSPPGEVMSSPSIADDGTVAAFGLKGNGYVWSPSGTRRSLATLPGGSVSDLVRIRGQRIVGTISGYGAVEWDLSGNLLTTPGPPTSTGVGVTSTGTVLESYRAPDSRTSQPAVVDNGEFQVLAAPPGTSTTATAAAITDAGVVGGAYTDPMSGQLVPAQWTCAR